jgi:hypothetical protein
MATQSTNRRSGESPFYHHAVRCPRCRHLWAFAGYAATVAIGRRVRWSLDCRCGQRMEVEFPPGTRVDSVVAQSRVESNNLALPEQREMAERAVHAGIGQRAGAIRHFSVVADPSRTCWQIQIRLRLPDTILYVDVPGTNCTAGGIERCVREALDEG